jgi:hypothetical protein
MKITILGSCRQHSLNKKYDCTSIQENLSYPHYTKEILEVIKYIKYNHILEKDTINIFRTPILNKKSPNFTNLNREFISTDLFILEIASKIKYNYNNIYVHHIATDDQYNVQIKNDILIETQLKEEIEEDILNIKKELNKPFIIVSHLVTIKYGERYILSCWLEDICKKHEILFINPVNELKKKDIDLKKIFNNETILAHYNNTGHDEILKIYEEYINKIIT